MSPGIHTPVAFFNAAFIKFLCFVAAGERREMAFFCHININHFLLMAFCLNAAVSVHHKQKMKQEETMSRVRGRAAHSACLILMSVGGLAQPHIRGLTLHRSAGGSHGFILCTT